MVIEPRSDGSVDVLISLTTQRRHEPQWRPTSDAMLVNAQRFYPLESIYHDAWKPGVLELNAQILALMAI